MPLSAEDVNIFIHNCQRVDQDFARQLAFILFTDCSVRESSGTISMWTVKRSASAGGTLIITGPIKSVLLSQPHGYHPYIFKYRYPESFKQRLRTAVKELGIRPMVTLENLREGYR